MKMIPRRGPYASPQNPARADEEGREEVDDSRGGGGREEGGEGGH